MKTRTIGEAYGPAMEITTQEEADRYFEGLVSECMEKWDKSRAEAEAMQRANLGYYAGYYSDVTRERVELLFKCSHPIFGSIAQKGPPTSEEAFAAGRAFAKNNPH